MATLIYARFSLFAGLSPLASQHPDRVKTLAELWEKQTQAFTEMVQSGAGVFHEPIQRSERKNCSLTPRDDYSGFFSVSR
jgi:hypothetical protein